MNFDIENELRPLLSKDEKLLWTGRPKTGIVFRSSDIFIIPFSLLWFGFAVYWQYNAIRMGVGFFMIWGIPFVVMGLYITVGRFFMDAYKRKHTVYAVTDSRVIIKYRGNIQTLHIKAIPDLIYKEKADGSGTITFGSGDSMYATFGKIGNSSRTKASPCFDMIEEAGKVYNLLIQQQRS